MWSEVHRGDGEMAQLALCTALAEDAGSVPTPISGSSQAPVTPSPRVHEFPYPHTDTHIYRKVKDQARTRWGWELWHNSPTLSNLSLEAESLTEPEAHYSTKSISSRGHLSPPPQ